MSNRELYFISGSPPCWSVMLALAVKGLDYTPRRLSNTAGEQKSPEFQKINPRGHVPVLIDENNVIPETLAVLNYIELAHRSPPLFGTEPTERALIWQTISECFSHLRGPVGNISRPLFRGKSAEFEDQIQKAAAAVQEELALLERRLTDSEWLTGQTVSAADLIVYPVLMQLTRAAGLEDAAWLDLPISTLDVDYPALTLWQARIESLPGYEGAYPPHWKDKLI